jgi:acetyl-CoA carboxylase carboxyl transferase subunit alpha
MGLTAERLKELDLVDMIVDEPLGGAHRDIDATANNLKAALLQTLEHLQTLPTDKLLEQRYNRLMQFGNYTE